MTGPNDYSPHCALATTAKSRGERAKLTKVSDLFKWPAFVRERLIVRDRLPGISAVLPFQICTRQETCAPQGFSSNVIHLAFPILTSNFIN